MGTSILEGRAEKAERIRRFCAAHPGPVLFDPQSATLFEVSSGRSLALDLGAIRALEERENRETGGRYLAIAFEDGRTFALAAVGIAFPPDPRHTGPLASLPPAVCLGDFARVTGKLRHILEEHPDEGITREEIDMAMFCVALLDGARALGFEIGREERELEALLGLIEARSAG